MNKLINELINLLIHLIQKDVVQVFDISHLSKYNTKNCLTKQISLRFKWLHSCTVQLWANKWLKPDWSDNTYFLKTINTVPLYHSFSYWGLFLFIIIVYIISTFYLPALARSYNLPHGRFSFTSDLIIAYVVFSAH